MQQQNSSISNFKRFFGGVLLPFIVLLTVFGYTFTYFFEQYVIFAPSISGAAKINRILHEVHKNEIPIFGSSRAEGTFFPDSLGPDFYNYGISGTQEDVMLFFLQQEVEKKKTTPIIMNFDLDGMNKSLGDIGNYIPNVQNPAVATLIGSRNKVSFNIPFINYYGKYELYIKYLLSSKMELTKATNKGASIDKNALTVQKFHDLVQLRKRTPLVFNSDSALVQQYLAIFSAHQERQFIFTVIPYHESTFAKYENYDEAMAFLRDFDRLPNVKVFDFSKLPFKDELFLNTSHLNFAGAKVFNKILRDSLAPYTGPR